MSILMDQQDETIDTIDTVAGNVAKDTETGYECWQFVAAYSLNYY